MKILGFYEELWKPKAGQPRGSILEARQEKASRDSEAINNYLQSGTTLLWCMAFTRDVFGSDQNIAGSDSPMTDGEWVWKSDLLFYYPVYHVRLEDEFIEKVRALDYRMPHVPESRIAELTTQVTAIW